MQKNAAFKTGKKEKGKPELKHSDLFYTFLTPEERRRIYPHKAAWTES